MNTEEAINSKWDAIDSATSTMRNVRSDLFDNVALALSRAEGKLKFLNSLDHEGKGKIMEGHCQIVGLELEREINQTRRALNQIFVQISDGKDALLKM
tara:strand:- start:89 stop:382 length:294 start_codon:yes stop_codon:yes gene_type:complete